MNKTIKFDMNDEFILISINEGEPYKISTKERILSAEAIYNLLDYSIGDKYSYEEIKIEGKDGVVINKIPVNVSKYESTYYYSSTPYRAKPEKIVEKPVKPREIYKFENDGNLSNEKTKEIMSELDDFLRKQNS